MEQHNFSNQKQIELLQIINYALYKKEYPQDLCGILDRKIQILQQPPEASEKDNPDACTEQSRSIASIKVRSVVILELLKQMQLGTVHNDLTKICKLIAFLTGNSYNSIYNEMQKGIYFSKFHGKQIDEANKILEELNASISINKNKQY
ncbi:MAG: hypothetical protein LBK94_04010 [Prevotellaceae bacterium]|nr:hypothetical protein [Prevotellaceae bacterium]